MLTKIVLTVIVYALVPLAVGYIAGTVVGLIWGLLRSVRNERALKKLLAKEAMLHKALTERPLSKGGYD